MTSENREKKASGICSKGLLSVLKQITVWRMADNKQNAIQEPTSGQLKFTNFLYCS